VLMRIFIVSLQYDEMWAKHPGFVKYDYKKADEVRCQLAQQDCTSAS
jgi:hypothetical protein